MTPHTTGINARASEAHNHDTISSKLRQVDNLQFLCRQQQLDRPGLAWNPTDQTAPLKLDDHVVDGRGRDLKDPLEVRFGRWRSVKERVRVEEG